MNNLSTSSGFKNLKNSFYFICVESSFKSKVDLVIDPFKEIFFRRLRDESVNIT